MGEKLSSEDISGGPGSAYVNQDGPSYRLVQITEQEARFIRTYVNTVSEVDGEQRDDEDKIRALAILDAALIV